MKEEPFMSPKGNPVRQHAPWDVRIHRCLVGFRALARPAFRKTGTRINPYDGLPDFLPEDFRSGDRLPEEVRQFIPIIDTRGRIANPQHRTIDWLADYLRDQYGVKSRRAGSALRIIVPGKKGGDQ
jgi:hypothetical protein